MLNIVISLVSALLMLYAPDYSLNTPVGDRIMAKSQDAKKNVKKAPTRTPAEKKALKLAKKQNKGK